MRITASAVAALGLASSSTVSAFAPIRPQGAQVLSTTARFVGLEPGHFQDLAQSHPVDSLLSFGSMLLSDVDMDAAAAVVDAATDTAAAATDAAAVATDAAASSGGGGPMGIFAGPIEGLLEIIHSALVAVGVDSNSWGLSILLMTATIKLLTFPLTKTQLESTNKMQVRVYCVCDQSDMVCRAMPCQGHDTKGHDMHVHNHHQGISLRSSLTLLFASFPSLLPSMTTTTTTSTHLSCTLG